MNILHTMYQNTTISLCIIQLLITLCLSIMKYLCIMSQPITSLPTMKFLFIMKSLFTTMFLFIIVLPLIMKSLFTTKFLFIIVLPFIMKSLFTMTHLLTMLFHHTMKKRLIIL